MRGMIVIVIALCVMLATHIFASSQSNLEREIEMIFRYDPVFGEEYNRKAKLDGLGRHGEVKAVLIKMLSKYKHSEPETLEYIYLNGATWALGEMKEQQAASPLSQMLFDKKVHENVRALAARSLGQIDAEGNKQLLLRALDSVNDYHMIRIYAAEALAETKDPQALKALEKYSREERDPQIRQKFEKAARDLRAKIARQR